MTAFTFWNGPFFKGIRQDPPRAAKVPHHDSPEHSIGHPAPLDIPSKTDWFMGIRDPYFMDCYNPKKQLGFLPRKKKSKKPGSSDHCYLRKSNFHPTKMWSNLNDPCIFREISQQETATFLWRKFASGRSKGGRRMALCLAKLRSAKGEEKPSRKGTCKSWGSTKQQQNTWVFSPGIAIDRGYPRGSFHLKIREVRGWCMPQLDPTGVLEIFVTIERSGATCSYIGYIVDMSKKVKRKATASGSCTTLSEKERFFEIPQKFHQTLSIWKAQKKTYELNGKTPPEKWRKRAEDLHGDIYQTETGITGFTLIKTNWFEPNCDIWR